MPTYLDVARWPRRAAFDYFRSFDKPYFNVCTRLDVAPLKTALADRRAGGGLSLAMTFLALRLANEHPPFRYRLEEGHVRVHDIVDASTTVMRDDDSFGFASLGYTRDYAAFARAGLAAIDAARAAGAPFAPRVDASAVIHFTSLPWIHFTSFSHARNWGREDSVPKIAFGRADAEGGRLWMPVSVEVHHALMDGAHVGRYVEDFERALKEPAAWLSSPSFDA